MTSLKFEKKNKNNKKKFWQFWPFILLHRHAKGVIVHHPTKAEGSNDHYLRFWDMAQNENQILFNISNI